MTAPLGLESKIVRLVPYDERWPMLFEAEARRIAHGVAAAGLPELALEHVGSTAVPGLAAKPVLDIAAGCAAGTAASDYVGVLEALGYLHRGDRGVPGREFFRRGELRSHHLHLVERNATHWTHYVQFRDTLRGNPSIRDAYAALKHALAARYPRDREAYILGKMEFIERVLRAETRTPEA